MFAEWPLLTLVMWTPLVGAVLVALVGDAFPQGARRLALACAVLTLAWCIPLVVHFDPHSAALQFVEQVVWIAPLGIHYALGVDGISLPLIVLTSLINVLVIIAAWEAVKQQVAHYLAAFLALAGLMNGVFAAQDAILFYVLFEAMLIPMFLIIGIWGGPNRIYATLKFFLYTFLGSVLMLIALIYLYTQAGSFALTDLHAVPLGMTAQILIFLAFFGAFAVKIPMWPVHTWLPDAHVEAPTGGSVVLAAIMLKIGGYGFLRFSLPITPDAAAALDWLMITFSLVAIVYIGFVALAQQDMKKLIAYSSIAHMGFVTLGTFIIFMIYYGSHSAALPTALDSSAPLPQGAVLALSGAMVQMISHGLISAALFFCVGALYSRLHSRQINDYGGVVQTMPWFAALFVLFAMANAGLPGTSGFVGELLVILASFKAHPLIAVLAATTLILGAAYSLWLIKRVVFGPIVAPRVAELHDLSAREAWVLGLLAALVLLLGLWPAPLLQMMHTTLEHLLAHVAVSKLL